jgi:hypothetical protein
MKIRLKTIKEIGDYGHYHGISRKDFAKLSGRVHNVLSVYDSCVYNIPTSQNVTGSWAILNDFIAEVIDDDVQKQEPKT